MSPPPTPSNPAINPENTPVINKGIKKFLYTMSGIVKL